MRALQAREVPISPLSKVQSRSIGEGMTVWQYVMILSGAVVETTSKTPRSAPARPLSGAFAIGEGALVGAGAVVHSLQQ
jgi:hypothetical protein